MNAITVSRVSKDFVLPHERVGSIKGLFTGLFRKGKKGAEVQHALKDISFNIKKGEFFGIVGRNGSGKSTMLKMLAGIYQPQEGQITVEGKLVPFIELGVGFNPELTGKENVYLNGALLNFSEAEVRQMYEDIVGFAELEGFMDQKLKNYSSGMQVRLAFSMAVRAKADVLLIDEVLAVGDADFQRKCFNYFDQLKKQKKTVVFVSHEMDAVRKYCDRAVLFEKGKIAKMGSAEEIAQAYTKQFTHTTQNETVDQDEEEEASPGETENVTRWGDGGAKLEQVKIDVKPKHIRIDQMFIANKDIEGLIAGIRVRNAAGVHILGSNTKIEKMKINNLRKGQKYTLHWTIPNFLSDGQYVLDPALIYADEITVADWWDDALKFNVEKTRKLPYPTDPDFDVKLVQS